MAKSKMPKHGKAFSLKYVRNGRNATAAARELPGVSENSAHEIGARLLRNVYVQAEISRLEKLIENRTLVSKERILNELAIIGFADMQDYVRIGRASQVELIPFDEMPPGASRAVESVLEERRLIGSGEGDGKEIILDIHAKYKHHSKLDALKELSKLMGYYPKAELPLPPEGASGVLFYIPANGRDVKPDGDGT